MSSQQEPVAPAAKTAEPATARRDASQGAGGESPEADVERDPQTGQVLRDPSLRSGDPAELSDGGARSSRHTGEDPTS
jgi:hypothetical protein